MTQSAESIRATQRTQWSAAAPSWAKRRTELGVPTGPITDGLVAAAGIAPGQRVLDFACGAGDPSFAIAEVVGPSGSVLGLDLTPAMIEGAQTYARVHAVQNATFRVIESELELGVPAASFDAATSRHGVIFTADPAATVRTLAAALKPGARLAISTWGPPERVPFFSLPTEIVGRHVEMPPAQQHVPGLYALPSLEVLTALLTGAGFVDLKTDRFHAETMTAPSPDAYWDLVSDGAGPLVTILANLTDAQRAAIRADAVKTLGARFPDSPVSLGGEVLIVSGSKR